jgi:hypothetical protein
MFRIVAAAPNSRAQFVADSNQVRSAATDFIQEMNARIAENPVPSLEPRPACGHDLLNE